jgi:formylglycine-generating enzyme required for sulfatase activity
MVALPRGFLMSRSPVTRAEFQVFAAETGFAQPNWGCKWNAAGIAQEDDHPVVCVSWLDATAYAEWLTESTGHPYRLPSFEESAAAAAGATSRFGGGMPSMRSVGTPMSPMPGSARRFRPTGATSSPVMTDIPIPRR